MPKRSKEPESLGRLLRCRLVPVEVSGTEPACNNCLDGPTKCAECGSEVDGYGLMDAVSAWSDCNRAEGHIFRFDDSDRGDKDVTTITVYVPEDQLWKLAFNWSSDSSDDIEARMPSPEKIAEVVANIQSAG